MKAFTFKSVGAAVALTCLIQPQIALAQSCVEQADVADATVYAMPLLYKAYTTKCQDELRSDGFIATRGDRFVAPYIAQQNSRWPGAARLLGQFAAGDKNENSKSSEADLFASLPEDALRPFVDAIVTLKVGEEIKLKDCGKIERTVELLSPLPPENVGGFLALLLEFADVKNPKLCTSDAE